MRRSLFQKRIPTVFGFLFVGVGIFLSSYFLQNGALLPIQAGSGATPQNVRISNVTDTSFTLSYTTTDNVVGAVVYGTDERRVLDDRDRTETPGTYTTHSITLKDLTPNTEYSYKILSGNKEYLKDGVPFTFRTPSSIQSTTPNSFAISGSVVLTDPDQAIVYASTSDSQVISTLTDKDGSFAFTYQNLRSQDFTSNVELSGDSAITVLAVSNSGSSRISSILNKSNPIPQVILAQNYDFTIGSDPIGTFNASDSANLAGFPSIEVEEVEDEEVTAEIISPEKGEGFSDQQPEFNGRALPNEEVEVVIHSDQEIRTTVTANSRGSWSFRPDQPLSPGEHTITIRTRDAFGILKEIQQSFVVYAEGSQFTDPSVSPVRTPTTTRTPTPTLTPTRTPSPSLRVTSSPTIIPPTPIVTEILSPIPSPTLIVVAPSISPVQPPPDAGSPALVISGLVGVITISVGLFVLFMSKGGAL